MATRKPAAATSAEKAIRDAAAKLKQAIEDGREAGLIVTWPSRVEGLASIAINQSGK